MTSVPVSITKTMWKFVCIFLFVNTCSTFPDVELTDTNFDTQVVDHKISLIMFFAPWCPHCQRLKPEFEEAAQQLQKYSPDINLMKVDCTGSGKATCERNNISGYPTLKLFKHGEYTQEYLGPRDAESITKFMKAQIGPSSKELENVNELHNFLTEENDVSLVGFFDKGSNLKSAYMDTADKFRGKLRFAHTSNSNLMKTQGIKNGIVLFRPAFLNNQFESNNVTYSGEASVSNIDQFISSNMYGLVGIRTLDNMDDFLHPLIVAYYDLNFDYNAKTCNYWRNRVLYVAKLFEGQMKFAVSSPKDFPHDLEDFGLNDLKTLEQPLIVARDKVNRKFVMKEKFTMKNLESFTRKILHQELEPFLRSEPVPHKSDDPVKQVVGITFSKMFINNTKDILIEFYNGTCDECVAFRDIYEDLAEKLVNERQVVIARVNVDLNDIPFTYSFEKYPVLYWKNRNSSEEPMHYTGRLALDELLKFVAKHATEELKGYNRKGKKKQRFVKDEF